MFLGIAIGIWIFLALINRIAFPMPIVIGLFSFAFFTFFSKHNHVELMDIDTIAMDNRLKSVEPLIKIVFTLIVIVFCLISSSVFVCTFVTITMSIITIYIGRIKLSYYINLLKIPLLFISLSSIGIILQSAGKPLGYYDFRIFNFILSVTKESQEQAIILFFKAYAGLSSLYFLGISTSIGDIISALRKVHFPEILIELMYLIYRYIILIFDTFTKLNHSASLRFGYNGFYKTYNTSKYIATKLMNFSFEQSMDNYQAMESRLYDGRLRFLENEKALKTNYFVSSIIYISILIFIFILEKNL